MTSALGYHFDSEHRYLTQMLFWLRPEPGQPDAGLRLASSTAGQGAEPETSFAGAAGAVHWLGRVALHHTNDFSIGTCRPTSSCPTPPCPYNPRSAPFVARQTCARWRTVGQPGNAGACSKASTLKHCRRYPSRRAVPFVSAAPALNRRLPVHATGPSERRYDRSVFLKETEYADVPH